MKATGLAPMFEEILQIRETREATEKALAKAETKLEALHTDAKVKKADVKRLMNLDDIENDIRMCAAKAFWVDVREAGDVMETIREKLNGIQEEAKNTEKALAEAEADLGKENDCGRA